MHPFEVKNRLTDEAKHYRKENIQKVICVIAERTHTAPFLRGHGRGRTGQVRLERGRVIKITATIKLQSYQTILGNHPWIDVPCSV